MTKKKLQTLLLFAAAILAISATAAAQTRNRNITALMNYELTIRLDGEALTLRDVSGNEVQPLTFEGTTYLPLRALAEIVGLEVDWDAATQTVLLTTRGQRELWLADHAAALRVGTGTTNNRASLVRGAGSLPQRDGAPYNSALAVSMSSLRGTGTIELNGIYTSLTIESTYFETPRQAGLSFSIVNADTDAVLYQATVAPNTFYGNISFNLYGATRLRVEVPIDAGRGNDDNTLFLLNPLLVD